MTADLASVLPAMDGLRAEIARLTARLRTAEGRISQLEAGTRTSDSPLSSYVEILGSELLPAPTDDADYVALGEQALKQDSKSTSSLDQACSCGKQHSAPHRNSCLSSQCCKIQYHLKPINDGIATLKEHLTHIENSIPGSWISSDSSQTSSLSSYHSCHTCRREHSGKPSQQITAATQTTPPSPQKQTMQLTLPSTRDSPTNSIPTHSHPVFGQTSTPNSRTQFSLSISGSPFGNYVHEHSPFSRLSVVDTTDPGALAHQK
jgi:hypothetical protein